MLLRLQQPSLANLVPSGPLTVDMNHRLAKGLIGAFVPGSVGGRNLVGSEILIPDSGAKFGVNSEGRCHVSNAANGGLLATAGAPFKNWTNGFTLYWRGILHGARIGGNGSLISVDYDNAASDPFVVAGLYNEGSVASPQIALFWNSAGTFVATGTPLTLTAGQIGSVAGTFGIGGSSILYNNGLPVATDTFGASAPTSSATAQITIGTEAGVQARSSNASTFVAYAWNRVLTQAELQQLEWNAYDLLISNEAVAPYWAQVAGAPPTGFFGRPYYDMGRLNV